MSPEDIYTQLMCNNPELLQHAIYFYYPIKVMQISKEIAQKSEDKYKYTQKHIRTVLEKLSTILDVR